MKIIVDAFGGDNAPLEILKACAEAVTDFDIDILLTGDQDEIRRVAKENNISLNRMERGLTSNASALDEIQEKYGFGANAIVTMEDPILPWQKDAANWLRETETHLFQPATAVLWL